MAIKEEIKRTEVSAFLDIDTAEVYNFIIDHKVILTFPTEYIDSYRRDLESFVAYNDTTEATFEGIYGDCVIEKINGAEYRVIKGKDVYLITRLELTKLFKIKS